MAESLLLALAGGSCALGAWLFFDGYRTSTLNWDTFSQGRLFDVTRRLSGNVSRSSWWLGGPVPAIARARFR
jgi:hypothetical protein